MTYKFLKAAIILTVIFSFTSSCFASEASQAINNFAFNAGKIIAGDWQGSFFFSPYSIISAFGMAYAGAEGSTASEIEQALGISRDIHTSLGELISKLSKGGSVSSANRIWLKEDLKLRKKYTETLRLFYGSTVKKLDFKGETEASRKEINAWISGKTNGKINDLLQTLDPETRMAITNAVYFHSQWDKKFSKSSTRPEKFWQDSENSTEVPMMRQRDDFGYAEFDGIKIVRLPYEDWGLSMVVVLPPMENPDALKYIDAETFRHWLDAMSTYDVDLWLPKFKTEKRYELKELFGAMGVKLAFTDSADFSGITGDEALKVDAVIHQAFVNTDEEGTEAAAATAVMMLATSAMPVEHPKAEFHADHPFMYLIMDGNTILFMGYQSFR
ncbi:MAG: serpin family protein [Synergistaceae bacterium]|nr:serpin family protein [Synergistaceae bacterium]